MVLLLVIAGLITFDVIFADGRGSIFAARHFVDLVEALAFWR